MLGGPTVICRLWSDLQTPFQHWGVFIIVGTVHMGELNSPYLHVSISNVFPFCSLNTGNYFFKEE